MSLENPSQSQEIELNRVSLGSSEPLVSRLGMGCWAFAGDAVWGPQEESASIEAIHAALDLGINFFDTAPAYGNGESERVLGKALAGKRDRAFIATKISHLEQSRDQVMASCERSLNLLQTDYIDLMQIHWPSPDVPFEETIAALYSLKEEGKVKRIGVCNFSHLDMSDYLDKGGEMVSNQLPYSLLSRSIEFEILPDCDERDVAVLAYSPLMQGLLTGKYSFPDDVPEGLSRSRHFSDSRIQARHGEDGCEAETFEAIDQIRELSSKIDAPMDHVVIAWVLARLPKGVALVGARSRGQVEKNFAALTVSLSTESIEILNTATESVKACIGRNPDLWQSKSRFRLS